MRLALLLCLTLLAVSRVSRAEPLVCASAADAVTLVRASCQVAAECRFLFKDSRIDEALLTGILHMVRPLAVASSEGAATNTTGDDDVRALYWPAAWVSADPVLVTYSNTSSATTTNCTSLAAALATSPPPVQVRDLLHALVTYKALLASDRCPDTNELPMWDSTTGEYYCGCMAGRVCASSAAEYDLVRTNSVLLGVLVGVALLIMFVPMVYAAYQIHAIHDEIKANQLELRPLKK